MAIVSALAPKAKTVVMGLVNRSHVTAILRATNVPTALMAIVFPHAGLGRIVATAPAKTARA
jgi:hypothetical protein